MILELETLVRPGMFSPSLEEDEEDDEGMNEEEDDEGMNEEEDDEM